MGFQERPWGWLWLTWAFGLFPWKLRVNEMGKHNQSSGRWDPVLSRLPQGRLGGKQNRHKTLTQSDLTGQCLALPFSHISLGSLLAFPNLRFLFCKWILYRQG